MDAVNIVRLMKQARTESPAAQLPELDDRFLLDYVNRCIDEAFVIVADSRGRLLGSIAAVLTSVMVSRVQIMSEGWFLVIPQFRKKGIPERLLEHVETLLDKVKCPMLFGSNMLAPSEFDFVFRKRQRYSHVRATYLRMPPAVEEPAQSQAEVGT